MLTRKQTIIVATLSTVFFVVICLATVLAVNYVNNGSKGTAGASSSSSTRTTVTSTRTTSAAASYVLTTRSYNETSGMWSYSVRGTLPSPCYSFSVDPLVLESFPEQIVLNITETFNSDAICAQVVTTQIMRGTVQASEQATMRVGSITRE